MDYLKELNQNTVLRAKLNRFLQIYGAHGLEQALQIYENRQREYICKNKSLIVKIKIGDIYYLKIRGHSITVHTQKAVYQKYGSLHDELKELCPYGFVKCNQSCLVAVNKIRIIHTNDILLVNGESLHLSRNYAAQVLMAFHPKKDQAEEF